MNNENLVINKKYYLIISRFIEEFITEVTFIHSVAGFEGGQSFVFKNDEGYLILLERQHVEKLLFPTIKEAKNKIKQKYRKDISEAEEMMKDILSTVKARKEFIAEKKKIMKRIQVKGYHYNI